MVDGGVTAVQVLAAVRARPLVAVEDVGAQGTPGVFVSVCGGVALPGCVPAWSLGGAGWAGQ